MHHEDVRREIERGEGSSIEFKSTLRWNIKAAKNDGGITLEVLKAAAAFLNSSGGLLFIGVTDSGAFHGIASDNFRNEDQFVVNLFSYLKDGFGADATPYVEATTHMLDGVTICRVACTPSPKPVFVTFEKEKDAFFIRTGPMTTKLPASKIHVYINEHWPAAKQVNVIAPTTATGTSESFRQSALTDALQALSIPCEAYRRLSLDIEDFTRQGLIVHGIGMGPSPHVENALSAFRDRMHGFREKIETAIRILSTIGRRDSGDGKSAAKLANELEAARATTDGAVGLANEILKGMTLSQLLLDQRYEAMQSLTSKATEEIVRLIDPEPKPYIFLRPELTFTPGANSRDEHDFSLHVNLVNAGEKPTNDYKVEVCFPTRFLAGRPSDLTDQAASTPSTTLLRYPSSTSAATRIYPGKAETIMNIGYRIMAKQIESDDPLNDAVRVTVFQPDKASVRIERQISALHDCILDGNGTVRKRPTLREIEASFRRGAAPTPAE